MQWRTKTHQNIQVRGLLEKLEKFADKFDSERNIYMIAAKLFRFKLKVFSKE